MKPDASAAGCLDLQGPPPSWGLKVEERCEIDPCGSEGANKGGRRGEVGRVDALAYLPRAGETVPRAARPSPSHKIA